MQIARFNTRTLLLLIVILAAVLRLALLDRYPSSLFLDEVSQGYNAYSLLHTGKDEFGVALPMALRAFGEWKPPLQTYLMIPTIALFGLNAWGVRLMSGVLGTGTVIAIYYLVFELFRLFPLALPEKKQARWVVRSAALFSAVSLALAPWHIVQSRSALHGAITVFFLTWGMWAFLKMTYRPRYGFLGACCFSLVLYAYFGMQLTVILLVLVLILHTRRELLCKKNLLPLAAAAVVAVLLLSPLVVATYRQPDTMFGRAKYVSIFSDRGPELTVWKQITEDGPAINSRLVQFLHNKPHQYAMDGIRRFFHHLDLRFLFLDGPEGPPFRVPNMGILYWVDAIFLGIGACFLGRYQPALLRFLGVWIAITIVPGALTFMTPSANRIFSMAIPVAIMTGVGITATVSRYRSARVVILVLYGLSLCQFLYNYAVVMPYEHADWWNGGYREMISYLVAQQPRYRQITISGQAAGPYIFLLFYTQADPARAQKELVRDLTRDQFGFEHVSAYDSYTFPRHFTWQTHGDQLPSGSLLAVTAKEAVGPRAVEQKRIFLPNGETAFIVYRIL